MLVFFYANPGVRRTIMMELKEVCSSQRVQILADSNYPDEVTQMEIRYQDTGMVLALSGDALATFNVKAVEELGTIGAALEARLGFNLSLLQAIGLTIKEPGRPMSEEELMQISVDWDHLSAEEQEAA